MIVKRPSIFIYAHEPDTHCLREICAGIEEEGVLYELSQSDSESSPAALAWQAAEDSVLGSGIGIHGSCVAVQLRGCPKDKPIFIEERPSVQQCRNLGANSARAIKKLPFRFGKE